MDVEGYSRRLMPARLLVPALVLVLAAAGCGDDKKASKTTSSAPSTTETATPTTTTEGPKTDAAGCEAVEAPDTKGPGQLKKPDFRLDSGKRATVTLNTNCGPIVIALDVKKAPKTASSFASLAKLGFYDGLTFHRILADFVIQGGDPLGNGQGGPGYNIVEKPPTDLQYTRGIVAMAKAEVDPPGASGSQFFIVTAEDSGLPAQYALVGRVKSGFGTINKIAAEPVDGPAGMPLAPVIIESATLDEG
jgi:cyclophilin family peptidyl-prolyl cis-trans isomerase